MTETATETKEAKVAEQKVEEVKKEEHKTEEKQKKPLFKSLKGSNKREYAENISFLIIVVSAIMIAGGIALGSFIQGTVYVAMAGAFFVMLGIVVYIVSQFIGE